jgi:biopolymer transport protein ExbD
MRAGRRHTTPSFDTKLDMTPLIDCIFQLILFLVLTSQITIQAEDVELPFALEGEEADKVEDKDEVPPLLVNVVRVPNKSGTPEGRRAGEIVFSGKRLGSDERQAEDALKKELEREVRYDAEGRGRGYEAGPGGKPLSKLSVLVRSDKGVRASYVRAIFMACQAVGIYKVRVSTTLPQAQ